jgi:hypothetical protein
MKNWKHWTIVAIIAFGGIIVCFTACPPDGNNGTNPVLCTCPNGTVHTDVPCTCDGEDCICSYDPPDTRAPTANASADKTVLQLPDETSVNLNGNTSKDPDGGTSLSYKWTVKTVPEGASTPSITTSEQAITSVTGLKKVGNYVFLLTVKGYNGVENTVEVTIEVKSYTITKDVEVTFPLMHNDSMSNTQKLNFSPSYDPAISGDGFEEDDVIFFVTYIGTATSTGEETIGRIDGTTNFEIENSKFTPPSTVTFMRIFEYKDGREISSHIGTGTVNPVGNFVGSSVSNLTSPINLSLEKEITEVP